MKRLTRDKASEFLQLGFKEQDMSVPGEEISEVISLLDGIIGWLTSYGYYRLRMTHEEALERVLEEGSQLVKKELENFLAIRQVARTRYLTILKLLTRPLKWSEIKRGLQIELGQKIADNRLTNYLKELYNYGFIEKTREKYHLADPLIREAVKGMR